MGKLNDSSRAHFHCQDFVDWRFPDWKKLPSDAWTQAWRIQAYVTGCLFGLIGVLALIFLFQKKASPTLCRRNEIDRSAKRLSYTLQALLVFVGSTRVVVLCVDPYDKSGLFPKLLYMIMFSSADPALITGFSLLGVVLIQHVIASRKPAWWFRGCLSGKVILGMTVVHFAVNTGGEILFHFNTGRVIVYTVCNLLTILWGVLLSVFFPVMGIRTFLTINTRRSHKLLILVSCSAATGLCLGCLHVVIVVKTFQCEPPEHALLFGFASSMRIVEAVWSILLLSATIKTRRGGRAFICCRDNSLKESVGFQQDRTLERLNLAGKVAADAIDLGKAVLRESVSSSQSVVTMETTVDLFETKGEAYCRIGGKADDLSPLKFNFRTFKDQDDQGVTGNGDLPGGQATKELDTGSQQAAVRFSIETDIIYV
eukprot:m.6668 g.6668  ORF g.6668 m.6668 type:complete len:426 (+) comp16547_c0_seq1:125-1402(+)